MKTFTMNSSTDNSCSNEGAHHFDRPPLPRRRLRIVISTTSVAILALAFLAGDAGDCLATGHRGEAVPERIGHSERSIPPYNAMAQNSAPRAPGDRSGRSLGDLLDPGEEPTKLDIPDKAARTAIEQKVREVYDKEFATATTPEAKQRLAAVLAKQGEESTDLVERFVFWQMASKMASEAGEPAQTMDIVDRMGRYYKLDSLRAKATLLQRAYRGVAKSRQVKQVFKVADLALKLADQAVAAERFDTASQLGKLAVSAARRSKDNGLIRNVTTRSREIERLKSQSAAADKAKQTLREDPNDPSANLALGRWYCFGLEDYDKGLPLLAKGGDAALAELAGQDIRNPSTPHEKAALGDRWRELARKQPKKITPPMLRRAAYWYTQALEELKGLDRTRVVNRLQEVSNRLGGGSRQEVGVVEDGNVAAAANGTQATGLSAQRAAVMFDGKLKYTGEKGYAISKIPSQWTIALKEVYRLSEIRFLLFASGKRYYRYTVEVSPDGKDFTMLADRSQGEWRGWQSLRFTAKPVKAIRIKGLHNSKNDYFHIIEFEAYCLPPAKR